MRPGLFFDRRTVPTAVLLCALAAMPATQAREIRVTAPVPDRAAAPSAPDDATGAPLTPAESAIIARTLADDPAGLAGTASAPALHVPGPPQRQSLEVKPTVNDDGSGSVTVTQSLADSDIDAKVGADISTAAPPAAGSPSDRPAADTADSGGSGAAWASVGLPNIASVDARVDAGSEQGTLATNVRHSIPIGQSLAVTVQGNYSVTQTLSQPASAPTSISGLPLMTAPAPTSAEQASAAPAPVWGSDNSLKLNVLPTGTTLTADIATASNDPVVHKSISADQKLVGPLHVTTAVSDIGQPVTDKSITAGFKWNW
jgi:hypothetical protein